MPDRRTDRSASAPEQQRSRLGHRSGTGLLPASWLELQYSPSRRTRQSSASAWTARRDSRRLPSQRRQPARPPPPRRTADRSGRTASASSKEASARVGNEGNLPIIIAGVYGGVGRCAIAAKRRDGGKQVAARRGRVASETCERVTPSARLRAGTRVIEAVQQRPPSAYRSPVLSASTATASRADGPSYWERLDRRGKAGTIDDLGEIAARWSPGDLPARLKA